MNVRSIPKTVAKTAASLITGAVLTLSVPFAVQPAAASAYGCAAGNPTYGPSYYCVTLSGSGRYVSYVKGLFRGSAFVCNYRVTAEFFDTSWHWYQTYASPVRSGCATGGSETIWLNRYFKPGYMCSTLRYYNPIWPTTLRKMSVCHRIY